MSFLLVGLLSFYLIFVVIAYEEAPGDQLNKKKPQLEEEDNRTGDYVKGVPRDLKIVFTASINNSMKVVEATIHWNAPLKGKPPDGYELDFYSQVDKLNSKCENDFSAFYEPGIDKDVTSFTIPHEHSHSHEKRILHFGCGYQGNLSALANGRSYTLEFNVTIPDCVTGICRCPEKSQVPKPSDLSYVINEALDMKTNITNYNLTVKWSYENKSSNISSFRVLVIGRISLPISYNKTAKGVVRRKDVRFVSGETQYRALFNLSLEEKLNMTGVVVRAYDSHLCQSLNAEKLRNLISKEDKADFTQTQESHPSHVLLIGILIPVVMVTILTGTFMAARVKWPLKMPGRRFHDAKNSKDSMVMKANYLPTEHENLNLLYIPWEIDQARNCGKADNFEISYYRLKIGKEVGKGAFGRVYVAYTEGLAGSLDTKTVAVKQLKERPTDIEKEDFLAEIAMMKKVGGHPNIITMLACCTLQQPYCMVMEYVPYGDLLNYLRRLRTEYEKRTGMVLGMLKPCLNKGECHNTSCDGSIEDLSCKCCEEGNEMNLDVSRQIVTYTTDNESDSALSGTRLLRPSSPPSCQQNNCLHEDIQPKPSFAQTQYCLDPQELLGFAHQIALGMAHLANKGIVHRDLAARNILIDETRTLKISDFGLSRRGIYVNKRCGRVPLRWLSVEAIRDNIYSSQSDVWAFGVVLWEICTLGGFPYTSISDKELLLHLMTGKRLERPVNCAQELYSIMTSCWHSCPEKRPSFQDLCNKLKLMADHPHTYVNFDTITTNILFAASQNSCHI